MSHQTNHSFRGRLRKLVVALVLGGLLSGPLMGMLSQPVFAVQITNDSANSATRTTNFAEKIAELISQNALLSEITSLLTTLSSALTSLFDQFTDEQGKRDKVLLGGEQILMKLREKAAIAIADADTLDTKMQVQMEIAARTAPPKHEYLCKAMLVHQLAPTLEKFRYGVERFALKAIEAMYRGPTDNGMGAQYFADEYALRCYNKTASPVDGYPSECIDTTSGLSEPPGNRTFVDADLSPFTMDGVVTLEMPDMETKAVQTAKGNWITIVVPKPSNYNQKMWVAGLNYCFELAGPRPKAPWGDVMSSEKGKRDRATFQRGLAIQSTAMKNCVAQLAYHTRPNPSMTDMIAKQNKNCSSVLGPGGSGDGIFDATTIKDKFADCKKGLSPYLAENLEKAMCKTPSHWIAQGMAGAKHYKQMQGIVQCMVTWNAWQKNLAAQNGSIVRSVTGLVEAKKVWSDMSAFRSADISNPTGYEYIASLMREPVANGSVYTVSVDKKQSIAPSMRHVVKGEPMSADELVFPSAVEQ
ncbi:MAG: hypothetical protein PHW63_03320 [Alphaproteobacteria bacterium]|nr:hypothetical protein [Alphaproteobacteria bacterium]